jgi:transposase
LYPPQLGKTISRYKVDGGDVDAALERITVARLRLEKLGKPDRVVSIYEAGYDGFWLHPRLTAAGTENRVVDAASIPVERRSRRVRLLPDISAKQIMNADHGDGGCDLEASG